MSDNALKLYVHSAQLAFALSELARLIRTHSGDEVLISFPTGATASFPARSAYTPERPRTLLRQVSLRDDGTQALFDVELDAPADPDTSASLHPSPHVAGGSGRRAVVERPRESLGWAFVSIRQGKRYAELGIIASTQELGDIFRESLSLRHEYQAVAKAVGAVMTLFYDEQDGSHCLLAQPTCLLPLDFSAFFDSADDRLDVDRWVDAVIVAANAFAKG